MSLCQNTLPAFNLNWRSRCRRPDLAGSKISLLFFLVWLNLEISHSWIGMKLGVFERSCYWVIRGSEHLALILPRGGVILELSKPLCLDSLFESGRVDAFLPWSMEILCSLNLTLLHKWATWKIGQCSGIFNVAPVPCIAKLQKNFVCGTTFDNQMLSFGGIHDSILWCQGKMSWAILVKNGWIDFFLPEYIPMHPLFISLVMRFFLKYWSTLPKECLCPLGHSLFS